MRIFATALLSLLLSPVAAQDPNPATTPVAREDWGQQRNQLVNEQVAAAAAQGGDVDVVFIGDSITEQWLEAGRPVWEDRYGELRALNLGISADRTEHVLWRLAHGNLEGIRPKVAVVMIGTNNFGARKSTAQQTLAGIRAIVELLRKALPETRILLLDIFPRGAEFNAMRGGILQVNQALHAVHDGQWVHYLPIGQVFLEDDGRISEEVMPDQLHLSEEGYRRWADAIADSLQRLLQR